MCRKGASPASTTTRPRLRGSRVHTSPQPVRRPLVERGRKLTARCPFPDHEDPNPSLSIKEDQRLWHCFGCQRGGDVFSLHMFLEGHEDFARAIDELQEDARACDLLGSTID